MGDLDSSTQGDPNEKQHAQALDPFSGPRSAFPLEGRDLAHVTRTEIIEAIKVAPEVKTFDMMGVPSLARISRSVIVKHGRHVHPYEARNMQYVSQHTNICLPKVLDAWEEDDKRPWDEDNTGYLVMEYIDGSLVADIWDEFDDKARSNLVNQLYKYLQELHGLKLECPGPIGGGISDGSLFTAYGAGPFNSQGDIEGWFNNRLQVCHDFGRAKKISPNSFTGRMGDFVMCHLDIHPRNLVLDAHGKLWLLDWGCSGAYPAYFEAANMLWRSYGDITSELVHLLESGSHKEEIDNLLAITFALTTAGYTQPRVIHE